MTENEQKKEYLNQYRNANRKYRLLLEQERGLRCEMQGAKPVEYSDTQKGNGQMDCLRCNRATKVTDSRRVDHMVYRTRKCLVCGHVFHTKEVPTNKDGLNKFYAEFREQHRLHNDEKKEERESVINTNFVKRY